MHFEQFSLDLDLDLVDLVPLVLVESSFEFDLAAAQFAVPEYAVHHGLNYSYLLKTEQLQIDLRMYCYQCCYSRNGQ